VLYTVYILFSPKYTKIYVGYTSNLLERFKSHNTLGKKGYTTRYRPWVVIYCEYFSEKSMAMKREKELKSGNGRQWIHIKIKSEFDPCGFISA
jgi:putative endonuclease